MRMYAMRVCSICLFIGAIGFLLFNSPSQFGAEKHPDKLSKKSQTTAETRKKLIRGEIAVLKGHPWAGEYYFGDGLGVNVNLILAPKSGFVFMWHGCLGLYDLNYGDVLESDGRIKLVFSFPNERKGFQGIAPELLPIVWGERHYLIPADDVVDFANAVNAGFEPSRIGGSRFLLRVGEENKAVNGWPNIPPEYSEYLLERPIEAEISSVKESRSEESELITTVVLSVGKGQGVKPGMTFYVVKPWDSYDSAEVTTVDDAYSEARISQWKDEKLPRPSVGWKLSTRFARDCKCDGTEKASPTKSEN